ncbi:hypothetical protein ANN_18916 [Periplaneta americana]|uniref:PiggyBac transposable element-derived protein domain-containing protein n=1 Tax=Periplaneta americana TaxID=6978 RepID=A0ABQ8SQ36_PERAM|nr:hypothetical protein ANN_18916 [Periplaneta americana]
MEKETSEDQGRDGKTNFLLEAEQARRPNPRLLLMMMMTVILMCSFVYLILKITFLPFSLEQGLLLRNSRHHLVRSKIAAALRNKGWIVEEEISCLAENGSTRRVDILAYNADTKQGIIVDPTIRFEVGCHQSAEVHHEKKSIYEPTVNYIKLKYALIHVEVFGLLVGARGTIPAFFEEFRRQFALPTSLRDDIVIIAKRFEVSRRRLYWERSDDIYNEAIAVALSRDRFEFIFSNLHCCDNDNLDRNEEKKGGLIIPLTNAVKITAMAVGKSERTIHTIAKEGEEAKRIGGRFSTPGESRPHPKKFVLDDFEKNVGNRKGRINTGIVSSDEDEMDYDRPGSSTDTADEGSSNDSANKIEISASGIQLLLE